MLEKPGRIQKTYVYCCEKILNTTVIKEAIDFEENGDIMKIKI